jgi:hypothetical protein
MGKQPTKPYRIVYALTFKLEGGVSATLLLGRNGQAAPSRANDCKNGMPHWPKKRTIDLRVGDQVFFRGCWRTIRAVAAARDGWLTASEARECRDGGYLYRPRAGGADGSGGGGENGGQDSADAGE